MTNQEIAAAMRLRASSLGNSSFPAPPVSGATLKEWADALDPPQTQDVVRVTLDVYPLTTNVARFLRTSIEDAEQLSLNIEGSTRVAKVVSSKIVEVPK